MTRKTNTDIPPEEKPEADYGRKPYYEGPRAKELPFLQSLKAGNPDGGGYGAMMSRTNYAYSKQVQLEHSQFKKPYMPEEFQEMEGFNDYIQLLEYDDWVITIDVELPPGETGGTVQPGKGGCFVVCQINHMQYEWGEDCETLKVYFFGDYTGDAETDPLSRGRYASGGSSNVFVEFSSHPVSRTEGEWLGPRFYPQVFTFTGIGSGEDVSAIFMQDTQSQCPGVRYGSCTIRLDAVNDCCPELEWDYDNSDETIIREGTATLVVIGGDGLSYSWSLDQTNGSGFSLDDATTTIPTNTLNAAADACGSCTITVTSCSGATETSGFVRCTSAGAGEWVEIDLFTTLEALLAGVLIPGGEMESAERRLSFGVWRIFAQHTVGGYMLEEALVAPGFTTYPNPFVCPDAALGLKLEDAYLWGDDSCSYTGEWGENRYDNCCRGIYLINCSTGGLCAADGRGDVFYVTTEWHQYAWLCL